MQRDEVDGVTDGRKRSDQASALLGWNRQYEFC